VSALSEHLQKLVVVSGVEKTAKSSDADSLQMRKFQRNALRVTRSRGVSDHRNRCRPPAATDDFFLQFAGKPDLRRLERQPQSAC